MREVLPRPANNLERLKLKGLRNIHSFDPSADERALLFFYIPCLRDLNVHLISTEPVVILKIQSEWTDGQSLKSLDGLLSSSWWIKYIAKSYFLSKRLIFFSSFLFDYRGAFLML